MKATKAEGNENIETDGMEGRDTRRKVEEKEKEEVERNAHTDIYSKRRGKQIRRNKVKPNMTKQKERRRV